MAFLTDATPAHVFVSMKDPLPSKTTMLPLSVTVEEFLKSRGPSSSAAVRVVLVHGITEKEDEEQKEVREAKGNEGKESEVDGEVGERERVTQRAHEAWRRR